MSRTAIYLAIGALFGAIAMGSHIARAADLGKPTVAAVISAPAAVPDMWSAPYLEFSAAGQFAKGGNKNAAATVGLGYTYHAMNNPWVPGVFARFGASVEGNNESAVLQFDQPITAGVTLGYLVMPSTRIYGVLGYSKSISSDFRGPVLGAGFHLPVFGNLRLGMEYTAQFDRNFKADNDVVNEVRAMIQIPF